MCTMLAFERRRLIADRVRSKGAVSVTEMAEALGTSEITLRRDLRAMADEGLVVRTHGGAVLPPGLAHEPSSSVKANRGAAGQASNRRGAHALVPPTEWIQLRPARP